MKKQHNEHNHDNEAFKRNYRLVQQVFCPALQDHVQFNGKGLNHIFYRGSRSPRLSGDIEVRMRIFDRAVQLLKIVQTISGYATDQKTATTTKYWEFIGLIEQRRIKVIVRQKGNGQKHFWSVIPSWKVVNGEIINSSGKLNF